MLKLASDRYSHASHTGSKSLADAPAASAVHCCPGSFSQFKRGVVSSSLDLPGAPMHEGNSVCAGFTLSGSMNGHCQFHLSSRC